MGAEKFSRPNVANEIGSLAPGDTGANQAFFEKSERLAERFEADARCACASGIALGFPLAVR